MIFPSIQEQDVDPELHTFPNLTRSQSQSLVRSHYLLRNTMTAMPSGADVEEALKSLKTGLASSSGIPSISRTEAY